MECNSPPTPRSFALANGLQSVAGSGEGARVGVRSFDRAHVLPGVFDDLHYRFRPHYDQWTSSGQSKSANVLLAVGAAQR